MRGKRAKAYRKLMNQYALNFGFREPYQVLLDSQIVEDAARYKMDLVGGLERTLQGKVKPMITQCDMRHLYTAEPKDEAVITQAKTYERRRCGHHELEHPLSSLECLSQVVDAKETGTNKHRYVVASQDPDVRAFMRTIPGIPLVYINRSVMIMEPMAGSTESQRDREEKAKFRAGLKGRRGADAGQKRKRGDEDEQEEKSGSIEDTTGSARPEKKKRAKGPKAPNPLSMKKPKKREAPSSETRSVKKSERADDHVPRADNAESDIALLDGEASKRRRKRKHRPKGEGLATHEEGEAEGS